MGQSVDSWVLTRLRTTFWNVGVEVTMRIVLLATNGSMGSMRPKRGRWWRTCPVVHGMPYLGGTFTRVP